MAIEGEKYNGVLTGSVANDNGSFRTYKRRKLLQNSASKLLNKDVVNIALKNNSHEETCDPKVHYPLLNGSSDECAYRHWSHVLESICESLSPTEGESGGIQNSIREALKNPYTGHAEMDEETVDHLDGESNFCGEGMLNGGPVSTEGLSAVSSTGSTVESDHSNVSRLCERGFSKLLMSGVFASLCKLLSENFHGLKIDKLLDFRMINSRMTDGTYEHSPMLFLSDIQQLWGRLGSIAKEMISLSNNLSELSRTFCQELGGDTEPDSTSGREPEAPPGECEVQIKQGDPDDSVFCTCKQCGERSDEKDCLVCDSCETMFHVSCIKPSLKEIPDKSWFCASCTSKSVVSSHEDCVVCDRLNPNSTAHHNGVTIVPVFEEENSDGIIETGSQVFSGNKCLPCKSCENNLTDGEEFCICEHRFCQFKHYHIRCLSSKELKSYGPCWYCPSCLCRVCLTNKDDDDIVMCDGCDHGYHVFCMNPPRTSVPRGKWFCPKCDAGIKTIYKVKRFYEDVERYKRSEEETNPPNSSKKAKSDFVDVVSESGVVDLLLNAARTLSGDCKDALVVRDGK